MGEKHETDSKVFIDARSTICQELDSSAKFALSNFMDRPVTSEFAQSVCSLIEAIFIHGLRDDFFVRGNRYSKRPEPNFWPLVSKYVNLSIKLQIYALNQIKTEIGKARAWIRIAIGDRTLESYINLISKDDQISQFYKKGSFIRHKACVHYLIAYLQKLDSMDIVFHLNSYLLNSWTPNSLILAGLIDEPKTLPQNWLSCPNIGKVVARKFLPMKTPLDTSYDHLIESYGFRFHPYMVFHTPLRDVHPGAKILLWIDLTNSDSFYHPNEIPSPCKYEKIRGNEEEPPSVEETEHFIDIVDRFFKEHPNDIVVVHCTLGFNRTGFLISSYLFEKSPWIVEMDTDDFAAARPNGICKQSFLNELHKRYSGEDDETPKKRIRVGHKCGGSRTKKRRMLKRIAKKF